MKVCFVRIERGILNKKLIITLSVVVCLIVTLLILFWTLFGLSSVTVEFSSTIQNLNVTEQEIVEAGQFRMGACVLFEGKKKSVENINNHASEDPDFAYLRVVNIETIFPNKFVIHVAEREELFAVETENGQVLICDREFRVLRIEDESNGEYSSTQDNAILLKGLRFSNQGIKAGDFLQVEQDGMLHIYSTMLENNRNLAQQRGKFKEMQLGTYQDEVTGKEYVSLELTTFQNRKFLIYNIDFALGNKIQLMFATESAVFNQNVDENGNILNSAGQVMYVMRSESGELLPYDEGQADAERLTLSYSLLSRCAIKVDNLTLDENIDRTEEDIYYSFVLL